MTSESPECQTQEELSRCLHVESEPRGRESAPKTSDRVTGIHVAMAYLRTESTGKVLFTSRARCLAAGACLNLSDF